MSQQNIDFGAFPDDPNADAIRTAFDKVQQNFNELYSTTITGSVASVNGGAGITVNSPTGNVVVTSSISNVTLNTNTLRMGVTPANTSLTASITQTSSQQITIDIDPANVFSANFSGVSGALANLTGTLTTNSNSQPNITSVGTLANLTVTGNANVGNIGATGVVATTLGGTLTTISQPNVTSVGNLTSLNVTGNIRSSAYIGGNVSTTGANAIFVGDGGLLSNLTVSAGSSIVNGNSNVSITANDNVTTSVAGIADIFIVTSTGANVSGYLTVSGNITGANANLGNAVTANYFIGNLHGIANSATTAGTVTTAAQPNITSVGTLSSVTVTADVTAGNVYANSGIVKGQYLYGDGSNITNITISAGSSIVNGTSNVSIPGANGNVNTVVAGNTTLVVTGTGVNVAGNLNATGTITGNFNGNVINATQGNITSLGTLTGLNVSGASNLGPVGNVTITGGNANAFLMTNGSGTLTWNNGTLLPVQGSNSQVIFNDGGTIYAGNANLTFNKTTGLLTSTLLGGTLTTAAQPNITSLGSLTSITINGPTIANGTFNTGNANANIITANYYIGNGSNLASITGANVTGTVANAITAGTATTAGTVTTAAQPNITSVGTLTGLGVNGTITGVNITANTGVFTGNGSSLTALNASNISSGTLAQARLANASVTLGSTALTLGSTVTTVAGLASVTSTTFVGSLSGAATTAGTVTTAAQPNITSVGTLTSLTTTTISTGANSTAGTITGNWSLSAGSQLRATYADLAEYYAGDSNIEPGTVIEFGGTQEVQICNSYMSRLVAGIVTTKPAYIMNTDISCEYPIAIALQGRVPAKVIGPVKRGDMMVSSNNGHAISCKSPNMGTVLGKALTDFDGKTGIIEIMVGRT